MVSKNIYKKCLKSNTAALWPKPLRAFVANFVFRPSLFALRSSSLLPKSRSAKKVFKTCSKHAYFC